MSMMSNCLYHFKGMQYHSAATFRESSPCTNVPVHCPLCPLGTSGQHPTFWKYCFVQHMALHHTDDNADGEAPPLPFSLLKTTHISLAEGQAMGIPSEKMVSYRDEYGIPHSDAFDISSPLPSQTWGNFHIGRKRTGSEVSRSSATSSRDESPSKMQRTYSRDNL